MIKPPKLPAFFVSFLICSVILGVPMALAALYLGSPPAEVSAPEIPDYIPHRSEDMTVLLVGGQKDQIPSAMMLVRFSPADGEILLAALPSETMVEDAGRFDSAGGVWKRQGEKRAVAALSKTLTIPIDRYAAVDPELFVTIVDTVGTVEFTLEEPVTLSDGAVLLRAGRQLLDGRKIAAMLSSRGIEGGEEARLKLLSRLAADALNQRLPGLSPAISDTVFKAVANFGQTDLSYADFEVRKQSLRYLQGLDKPVSVIEITGDYNSAGNTFLLSPESAQTLIDRFGAKEPAQEEQQTAARMERKTLREIFGF